MNEAILKWLASGTIGLVVCSSLWLAGSVQSEVKGHVFGPIISQAPKAKHAGIEVRLVSRPLESTASNLVVKTAVSVN